MATQIGPKIGVDGEAEYRKQMANVIAEAKALKAEMTELKTEVADEATAQENAAKQAANFKRQIELQEERVKLLSEQLDRATTAYGEGSTQASAYREQLANAKTMLNQMRTEQTGATDDVQDFAEAEDEAGQKAITMGDLIKANVISDAIMAGLKKLAELGKKAAQALWGTVTGAAEYADTYLTMATTTGLSTDQLQEFAYMAELVDVSLDTMTGSMTKLTRQMDSARSGNEAAGEAFSRLGIKTTNADGSLRDSTEVFFELIEALGQMEDGSERDALAMEIFGKSAQQLNPLIAQGRKGIEGFAEEAREMGYVLDEETLGKLGQLDDSFQRLTNLRTMISNKLGAGMAPGVTRAIDKLIEFGERVDWDRVGNALGDLVDTSVDKLIEFSENVDFDKLADGALKLGEGIITGGTWLIEHADEILTILGTIGSQILMYKGVIGAKNAWDTVSGLLGSGKTATGAAAAAAPAAQTSAAATAASGGWGALALPLMEVLALGKGAQEYLSARSEALKNATLGDEATIEQLRANVQAQQQLVEDAQAFYNSREFELYEMWEPEDGWQLSAATAQLDAAQAALAAAERELADREAQMSADALTSGEDAAASYAEGFSIGTETWLRPALIAAAGLVSAYFHHSEPDIGPMADDADWMPDMMQGWARQINDNSPLVRDAMAGLAFDLQDVLRPGLQAPGGGVNYGGVNVVIYGADGQNAAELYEEFSYRLNQDVLDREAVFA